LKRFYLYKQSGFDEPNAEAALNTFLARELQWLNDHTSHNRIAKVVPVIGHDNKKFWLTQYPDAATGHGVKQWSLQIAKKFRVAFCKELCCNYVRDCFLVYRFRLVAESAVGERSPGVSLQYPTNLLHHRFQLA